MAHKLTWDRVSFSGLGDLIKQQSAGFRRDTKAQLTRITPSSPCKPIRNRIRESTASAGRDEHPKLQAPRGQSSSNPSSTLTSEALPYLNQLSFLRGVSEFHSRLHNNSHFYSHEQLMMMTMMMMMMMMMMTMRTATTVTMITTTLTTIFPMRTIIMRMLYLRIRIMRTISSRPQEVCARMLEVPIRRAARPPGPVEPGQLTLRFAMSSCEMESYIHTYIHTYIHIYIYIHINIYIYIYGTLPHAYPICLPIFLLSGAPCVFRVYEYWYIYYIY